MKQRCHSCLAWSEVRWMAGAAPESCFSHTLSASVSTAIHLLCPGASPCPLPPQGLLTKAHGHWSLFPTTQKKNASSSRRGFFIFFTQGGLREKKRASDKSSCYCHFVLVKLCSTQLKAQRCFITCYGIQKSLLD